MNTIKKLFCAFLAATFVVAALASCANNSNNEERPRVTGSNPVNTDNGPQVYEFMEWDYKGDEFKILQYGKYATDFIDEYIWSENFTGGVLGDAVIERNQLVEDLYNVTIVAEDVGAPMSEATKRMNAGQCDFDVIYEWGIRSKAAALDGLLYDLLTLPNTNMDRSYWLPQAIEGLTVMDRMFVGTNLVTMNAISWSGLIYFNKMLMDKLQYAYPYDYVYSNTWTYDVLTSMVIGAADDIDGDGEYGTADQVGGIEGSVLLNGICNDDIIKDNGDGTYTFIPYTEKMVAQYNKYNNKMNSIIHVSYDSWDENGADGFSSIFFARRWYSFGEDHYLFMTGSLDMTKEFVDMKSDYGIVPEPVVEAGDEYKSSIDYCAPMFSVPFQVKDEDMVGEVFDYMAYESERLLLPAYYETTIKTKRMEDVRDYDMIDTIRAAIGYDWTGIYLFGLEYNDVRSKMFSSGNFGSVAKRYQAKCQAEIDEVLDIIASIED